MKEINNNPGFSLSVFHRKEDRMAALQHWDKNNAEKIAADEGVNMQEEHWQVVAFLRNYYLEHGMAKNYFAVAEALSAAFSDKGGSYYLHKLFPEGAVVQGSRIAGLPMPPGEYPKNRQ